MPNKGSKKAAPKTGQRRGDRRFPGVYHNAERDRWEQRLSLDGRRVLVSAKTPGEVAEKVADLLQRRERGLPPVDERLTVAQYLDWWLDYAAAPSLKRSTLTTYRHIIEGHIVPHIGTRPLVQLSPADVTRMLGAMTVRRGDAEVAAATNTQRAARSVLRRALRRAQVEGLVTRNVAQLADGVRVVTREGRTMTPDQARAFLDHARTDRLGAAWEVMLALGLRRGELLGLAWSDLDLDGSLPTLRVSRTLQRLPGEGLVVDTPKTKGSARTVALPAFAVEALLRHRAHQLAEAEQAADEWVELPLGLDLVFRTPFGTAVDPANFKAHTRRLTSEAGIGVWTPHELRHSAASILLAAGVPLKVVSETLGHSSIRITADVYAHLLAPARKEAADAAQRVLG